MICAGLTGGLGCGKSVVGAMLAELGCHVIRADELGHTVLAPGGEAYEGTMEAFGPSILRDDATIDRRKLAALVFADPAKLTVLNNLVHPAVWRLQEEMFDRIAHSDPAAVVVVEAAILIETGRYRRYDKLIVVVCSEEQQIERSMGRDGSSRAEVLARIGRQLPLPEKRKYADYIIDNSGSREEMAEQVQQLYRTLRSLAV